MHKSKKTRQKDLVLKYVVLIVGTKVLVVGKAMGASRRRICVLAYRNIILEICTLEFQLEDMVRSFSILTYSLLLDPTHLSKSELRLIIGSVCRFALGTVDI